MTNEQQEREALEAMIDRAGRDKVFNLMRAAGWGSDGAPMWVWRTACYQAATAHARGEV